MDRPGFSTALRLRLLLVLLLFRFPQTQALTMKERMLERYDRLCRGKKLESYQNSVLHCFNLVRPLQQLAPFKVELISLNPHVALVHDFVTEGEADRFVELARPRLLKSGIVGAVNGSSGRVSQHAWLEERDPMLDSVSARVGTLTGLRVVEGSGCSAEVWQVAKYVPGGFYQPHYDYFEIESFLDADANSVWAEELRVCGDRVATLMVYLSDVEAGAGGATVFPEAELVLQPEKGAAALWWNLNLAGVPDKRTLHAGCPVHLGSKWVANKWIRYNDQWKVAPCGLDPSRKW